MMGRGKGGRFRVGLRNHTSLFCHWRHWQAYLTAIGQCGELMFGLASRFENSLATVAGEKKVFSPSLPNTENTKKKELKNASHPPCRRKWEKHWEHSSDIIDLCVQRSREKQQPMTMKQLL